MDPQSFEVLSRLRLPNVHTIALEDFEKGDEALVNAKKERTAIEYYFTCTPSLPLYILNNFREADLVTYLDADLFFFSDPTPLYEEISNSSVAIIGHRFPANLQHLEQSAGIYNVGWVSFRRDANGLECLRWWRKKCLQWCYDRVADNRYADQKYLDEWPQRFRGVKVLRHKGANLAPWNISKYRVKTHGDTVTVDEQALIFFHFHGLKENFDRQWSASAFELGIRTYDPNFQTYGARCRRFIRRRIFAPYIRMVRVVNELYMPKPASGAMFTSLRGTSVSAPSRTGSLLSRATVLKTRLDFIKGILFGRYILAFEFGKTTTALATFRTSQRLTFTGTLVLLLAADAL